MHMTACMRVASVFTLTALSLPPAGWGQSPPPGAAKPADRIKAFCIDFNWGPVGPNYFAAPGTFARADPKAHFQWYKDLGVNTIHTFCISCDGYAWYRSSGVAPVEPGLKHDFLKEITELAHKDDMRVMGYFCVGANTYWGQKHPDLSYGTPAPSTSPSPMSILITSTACIKDVLTKTDIDGFQLDWVYSPPLLVEGEERPLDGLRTENVCGVVRPAVSRQRQGVGSGDAGVSAPRVGPLLGADSRGGQVHQAQLHHLAELLRPSASSGGGIEDVPRGRLAGQRTSRPQFSGSGPQGEGAAAKIIAMPVRLGQGERSPPAGGRPEVRRRGVSTGLPWRTPPRRFRPSRAKSS